MRNRIFPFLPILLLVLGASSCIKDEKPNIEVDVLSVVGVTDGVLNVAFQDDVIDVYIAPEIDPSEMTLGLVVSDGATVEPDPETVTDYSEPRIFRVTSEDGQWVRNYTVRVRFNEMPTVFGFENWRQPERMRYRVPFEESEAGEEMLIWSCGNEAYNFLTSKDDDYTAFPTQPTAESHSGNYAARLETKLTGQLDKLIAAGNLFIGQFDSSKRDPRESTMFGLPFMKTPVRFKGMYRYASGGKTLVTGDDDRCKMQAVIYRTDDQVTHLNGLTIGSSPNVVARAEFQSGDTPGSSYVEFDIPFVYVAEIDREALASGGYNLAVIFSSSLHGDVYDGAPGSVLLIDDVEIVCETDK